MDDILNRIRVSREKEILTDHEKTINKALDYLVSIENTDEKKFIQLELFYLGLLTKKLIF